VPFRYFPVGWGWVVSVGVCFSVWVVCWVGSGFGSAFVGFVGFCSVIGVVVSVAVGSGGCCGLSQAVRVSVRMIVMKMACSFIVAFVCYR